MCFVDLLGCVCQLQTADQSQIHLLTQCLRLCPQWRATCLSALESFAASGQQLTAESRACLEVRASSSSERHGGGLPAVPADGAQLVVISPTATGRAHIAHSKPQTDPTATRRAHTGDDAAADLSLVVPQHRSAPASSDARAVCTCSGNCGSKLCRSRNMQRIRRSLAHPVCPFAPGEGRHLCSRCKCEFADCQRPRNRSSGRWCVACARVVQSRGGLKGSQYYTPYTANCGQLPGKYASHPPCLKVLCRLSFVLEFVVPSDFKFLLAFREGAPALAITGGGEVGAVWLCVSFWCR